METINGYVLQDPLTTTGSGFAKWGFGIKNETEYFIKEFLTPVYPLDGTALSAESIKKKRAIFEQFLEKKRRFYDVLNKCSTGNIVTISDNFRHGTRFYTISEKIYASPIALEDFSGFNLEQKVVICKVILHSIGALHEQGIVHGDIKPNNILFNKTPRNTYTAKIIDFDSSFLESDPPKDESEFQGDTVYLAPESLLFLMEEEGVKLTTKVDVFALGVLFHQYFSGELPICDRTKYDYTFEAVLDGANLEMDERIPDFMRSLILRMLDKNPENRPTVKEAFDIITASYIRPVPIKKNDGMVSAVEHRGVSKLKINMGGKKVEPTTGEIEVRLPEKDEHGFFKRADDLL